MPAPPRDPAIAAASPLLAEPIAYRVGGADFTGYLARDARMSDKRPGVLVVPEIWGINDYIRMRTRMVAGLGYPALAVDMYGGGRSTEDPNQAWPWMQAVAGDLPEAERRFDAALDILRAHPSVDGRRIAAIGYCFGGGVVLHMARAGRELAGVVSYHGNLAAATPAAPGRVRAEVLVFTGGDDPLVPAEQVAAFEAEMAAAGAVCRVKRYPGAKHAFTNPEADAAAVRFNMPVGYDAAADADSWAETEIFFHRILAAPATA